MKTMTSASIISVAVVEDDPGVRRQLVGILKRAPEVVCLGEFATAEEAVRQIPPLAPKVVFMDINLPGMNGVRAVEQLAQSVPQTQIVMLTMHDDTETIFQSLAAGAHGYLLKPVRSAELLDAVRNVSSGGVPMTGNIARKIIQSFKELAPAREPVEGLSEREREVLECLAKGYLYKEVASLLGITYGTVHTHIEHIYAKLHVRSRSQAIAKFFGQSPPAPASPRGRDQALAD
jgi:DNA-binding NarL/FixJ family response regulator